jgi:hypothetical protein
MRSEKRTLYTGARKHSLPDLEIRLPVRNARWLRTPGNYIFEKFGHHWRYCDVIDVPFNPPIKAIGRGAWCRTLPHTVFRAAVSCAAIGL